MHLLGMHFIFQKTVKFFFVEIIKTNLIVVTQMYYSFK